MDIAFKKGSEAVGQDVFSGASVEDGEVWSWETHLSEAFLMTSVVLMAEVMVSVKRTPKN